MADDSASPLCELGAEPLVGAVHATIGLVLVRLFEFEGRRGASLELV